MTFEEWVKGLPDRLGKRFSEAAGHLSDRVVVATGNRLDQAIRRASNPGPEDEGGTYEDGWDEGYLEGYEDGKAAALDDRDDEE